MNPMRAVTAPKDSGKAPKKRSGRPIKRRQDQTISTACTNPELCRELRTWAGEFCSRPPANQSSSSGDGARPARERKSGRLAGDGLCSIEACPPQLGRLAWLKSD
jgi:hypothetical protein